MRGKHRPVNLSSWLVNKNTILLLVSTNFQVKQMSICANFHSYTFVRIHHVHG